MPVFALAVGAVAPTPLKHHGAWDVINVVERRLAPVPSLDAVRAKIREELVHEAIQQEVQRARADAHIHAYNIDGGAYNLPAH